MKMIKKEVADKTWREREMGDREKKYWNMDVGMWI